MSIPVAVDDLIRIDLKSTYNSRQEMHNVFYYKVTDLPVSPDINTLSWIGAGFWYHLFTPLAAVTAGVVQWLTAEVSLIDIDNFVAVNSEVYVVDGAHDTGNASGDSAPAYVTWGFKYIRPTLNFRHGWKRFSGVPEVLTTGDFATPTALTAHATLETTLEAQIHFADPTVWGDTGSGGLFPVIIRAERGGLNVRPVEYDFPLGVVYNKLGTQNSRKYWVGI